jgi:hypothetical protein
LLLEWANEQMADGRKKRGSHCRRATASSRLLLPVGGAPNCGFMAGFIGGLPPLLDFLTALAPAGSQRGQQPEGLPLQPASPKPRTASIPMQRFAAPPALLPLPRHLTAPGISVLDSTTNGPTTSSDDQVGVRIAWHGGWVRYLSLAHEF